MKIDSYIDLFKVIFNEKEYQDVSYKDKKRHFFMINRRFAIKHPVQAVKLSMIRTNEIIALDTIHLFLKRYKGKMPQWTWTKGSGGKKVNIDVKYTIESKNFYIKENMISEKVFNQALDENPSEMQDILSRIDNMLKNMN